MAKPLPVHGSALACGFLGQGPLPPPPIVLHREHNQKKARRNQNSSSTRRASFVSLAQAVPHCCFPPVPPFRARRDPTPDNSPVLDQTALQEQHVSVTDPARSGGCTSLGFSFPSLPQQMPQRHAHTSLPGAGQHRRGPEHTTEPTPTTPAPTPATARVTKRWRR